MYKIGEFQSNVNQDYHKLINTRPIKQPQMNTGFETIFSQSYNEKWDKSYFAITKRDGFRQVNDQEDGNMMKRNLWAAWLSLGYDIRTDGYFVTDHIIVDGVRYIYVCSPDYKVGIILKKRAKGYSWCEIVPSDIEFGDWEVVKFNGMAGSWDSSWRHGSFMTEPCSYHKFQKIPTLQSNETKTIKNLYIGNVVLEGWTTTAVIFNAGRTIVKGLSTGDFIYLSDSDNKDIVVGQALQLWQFDAEHGWYNMGYGEWVGITDVDQEPIYDREWHKIWVLNSQWKVDVHVYNELKNGFAIVAKGPKSSSDFNDSEAIYEFDGTQLNKIAQTSTYRIRITSMCEDFGWLVYTTNKWYAHFIRPHNNFSQSLWGTIYNSMKLYEDWDVAKWLRDYIVFFWPRSMGIAFKSYVDERWDPIRWVKILDRDLWYYDKDSVMIYDNGIYMVDNKKRFVKIDIQAQQVKNTEPIFEMQVVDMSLHRINTDLRNLSKERWDYVHLCKDDYRIYIIIEDNMNREDDWTEREVNTKILVYEDELKYRHRWYLCKLDIRNFNEWVWMGRWLFVNKWNVDSYYTVAWNLQEHPFKEIISLSFWDTSRFTWKEVLWMKLGIWYHSEISKDTHVNFRADGGGYSKTIKTLDLSDTTAYITALNKLRGSGKTNERMIEELYRAMPIGIGVYSGNGVWLQEDIVRSLDKEFYQYCDYEETEIYRTDDCCTPKPASSQSDNKCTMKPPKAGDQNFGSDRFQYHFNIAKYATIPINIGQQWQNFFIEIIANEYDKVEFLGFMIWWMFMDNSFDSVYNMPYYQTTPQESLPWNIGN